MLKFVLIFNFEDLEFSKIIYLQNIINLFFFVRNQLTNTAQLYNNDYITLITCILYVIILTNEILII